jgi:hypothetical protein
MKEQGVAPFEIPPAVDGRIVFVDTEFTTLVNQERELWEGAIIIRDPGHPDFEFVWQVRPDLGCASRDSLRVGRYYRRNRLIRYPLVGTGLIIACGEQWDQLKPADEIPSDRLTTGPAIAAQVAPAIDDVVLVAAVPSADELALDRWLSANQQALTSHYRLKCIETMMQGYLLRHTQYVELLNPDVRLARPEPPYDPKPMYEQLGVPLLGKDKAHNALYDCRQVRDAWDAMHGRRIDTIH